MSRFTPPAPDSPGLTPPPGITLGFFSPFTLQLYNAVSIAGSAMITTTMVFLRLYTKKFVIKRLSWEDFFCFLGWTATIVYLGISAFIDLHGGGTHQWNLYYEDVQYNLRFVNYTDVVYSVALLGTKMSIMLLIKRVFCSVRKDIPYYLTLFLIFANTGFYTCYVIVPAVACLPRNKIWTPTALGKCVQVKTLYLTSAIFNMLSDIFMLSVPVYLIFQLQMSTSRKVGICAVFLTGGLACLASILRAIYTVSLTRTLDYTYVHMQTAMWAQAEITFGLLCSCLVVLPRLFIHLQEIMSVSSTEGRGLVGPSASGSGSGEARDKAKSHGKTKREWVQLEEQASRAQKKFRKEARLGDEEALNKAVDEART